MTSDFAFLTPGFFTRAEIWPGSLGTFRYRFQRTGWLGSPDAQIQAWVYENISFELAQQIETQTFPWTEEGVDALRQWLREKLAERGAEAYRIPYPSRDIPKAETSS